MSYLLYCLFRDLREFRIDGLTGIEGQPLAVLSHHGLNAVISRLAASQLPLADLDTILSYERVIDYFHRQRTIIPMRYGCAFAEEPQIVRLLEDRSDDYDALLNELEGCDEMGIRVLFDHPACAERTAGVRRPGPALPVAELAGTGRGYLIGRRSFYADRDQLAEAEKVALEAIREPFSGLFVRCRAEKSMLMMGLQASSDRLLSLYFLVKREHVGAFREVFQALNSRCSERILLSGPWAPYNFVVSDLPVKEWVIAHASR